MNLVGTTCVELDVDTIEAAVRIAGANGRLRLHPDQAFDLYNGVWNAAVVAARDGVPVVARVPDDDCARWLRAHVARLEVDGHVEVINGGADYCGEYVGPTGVRVLVVSAVRPREGR